MSEAITEFAPAERASRETLISQNAILSDSSWVVHFSNAIPDSLVVLNRQRQIVFANKVIMKLLGSPDFDCVLGLRPGEALHCKHAGETDGGCGTTRFCRTCGAVRAIQTSIIERKQDVQECQVSTMDGSAFDLGVTATPLDVLGEEFTIFNMKDISATKRRAALERIFFHDVLNVAGGLQGFADLMKDAKPEDQENIRQIIQQLSQTLIEEINAQRDLAGAESGELTVSLESIDCRAVLDEVRSLYSEHIAARNKHIKVDPAAVAAALVTDHVLLRRVIGNMTKNALEASKDGQTVALSTSRDENGIRFSIWSSPVIPEEAQNQIFNRSFSTKGLGHGLGTYSMKLLTERYLKGRVGFTSCEGEGTTFFAIIPYGVLPER